MLDVDVNPIYRCYEQTKQNVHTKQVKIRRVAVVVKATIECFDHCFKKLTKESQTKLEKKIKMQISKIAFLSDKNEQERVSQIVQAIIEGFDSESLGFSTIGSSVFFDDTPIQQFEDLCSIYDTDELATLETVKSLRSFLSQLSEINSYPNTQSLLKILESSL